MSMEASNGAKEKLGPDHFRYYTVLDDRGVTVKRERFVVCGETPCCWYVVSENVAHLIGSEAPWAERLIKKQRKLVLKRSDRRYCYPSADDAMRSFLKRQRWRQHHAQNALSSATLAMRAVKEWEEGGGSVKEEYRAGHDDHTRSIRWGDDY